MWVEVRQGSKVGAFTSMGPIRLWGPLGTPTRVTRSEPSFQRSTWQRRLTWETLGDALTGVL